MHIKDPVIKTCGHCGMEFRRPPSLARTKFCGAACWLAHHATKERVCQHCGKIFRRHGPGRNRGTGAKFCSKACSAHALRRFVEFRCQDCGRVEVRRGGKARYVRCGQCGAAYRAARLRGKPLPHVIDPTVREKWLIAQRTPERRQQMSELMTGREMTTEKTRRGSVRHFKALHFCVRSPAGVVYRVDNLSEFVRSNPQLFDPADVVNRSPHPASYQSRASAGLRKLQAVVGTRLSWKGWTLTFGWQDEIGRQQLINSKLRADG